MGDLKFNGWRPLHCNKPQEELEFSDFAKVIRPTINGKVLYARILIRRKTPEDRPIEDAEEENFKEECDAPDNGLF